MCSSQWFTPQYIKDDYIDKVLGVGWFDPCPAAAEWGHDGLELNWAAYQHIYLNPPIPPARWCEKALSVHSANLSTNILICAFSPNVLFQVPALHEHPICWVRKRLSYVDGRARLKDGSTNPKYLKAEGAATTYSAFVLLSNDPRVHKDFDRYFRELGTITQPRTEQHGS